jgi:hypothetical protein
MSTYGIDKSKSRVEVFPATQVYKKSEVYNRSETYAKAEVYNRTEADGKLLTQAAGAPKNHASSSNTYGLGTSTNYGHVKLIASMAAPTGDTDGAALAGSMGYTLKKYTDDQIATRVSESQLPVGAVVFMNGTRPTNAEMTAFMGYGTWKFIFKKTFNDEETVASEWITYAYKRTA